METSIMLLIAFLAPLGGAALLVLPFGKSRCWTIVMAAVTATSLAVVALPSSFAIQVPTLLMGSQFGLDPHGCVLVMATAAIWFAGSLYAMGELRHDPHRRRFAGWFLLAMGGNIGLILAQDMISFFVFFALMSLSSYGLVVHKGDYAARRAARIYMVFVIIGETAIFIGLALSFERTGSLLLPAVGELAPGIAELSLLVIGFGIKAGLLGLHMWLPLAHPAAPVAASAILSGAMLQAGLVGLLRFLPPGDVVAPEAGAIVLILGISGALFGAFVGVTQRNPKTVLAYSSVSQLGLALSMFAVALATPSTAPGTIAAIVFFSAHHGFAKAALFLGAGLAMRPLGDALARQILWTMLLVAACTLIGLAPTSGFLAKSMLSEVAQAAPGAWVSLLPQLLFVSSIATALLMLRFLMLVRPSRRDGDRTFGRPERIAFVLLLGLSLALPWLWVDRGGEALAAGMIEGWAKAATPLSIAIVLVVAVRFWRVRLARGVPPGDLITPLAFGYDLARRRLRRLSVPDDPLTASIQGGLKALSAVRRFDGRWAANLGLTLPFSQDSKKECRHRIMAALWSVT